MAAFVGNKPGHADWIAESFVVEDQLCRRQDHLTNTGYRASLEIEQHFMKCSGLASSVSVTAMS
jgi:hypothetical protein